MVCLSIVPPWDIWGCPNDCKPGQDKSCDDDWETQEVRDPTPNFANIKVVKSGFTWPAHMRACNWCSGMVDPLWLCCPKCGQAI